jgi:membrane protease YdiL (CAAX protease family)
MTSSAPYSPEPARGWIPWGALAPFLGFVFVVAPLLGASLLLEHFALVNGKGDPVGLQGLCALLLFPFSLIGLVVLAWVHFVERRSLATIGLVGVDRAKTFLRGHAIRLATSCAVVALIWIAGGYTAGGYGKAFGSASALRNIGFLLVCFAVQSSVEEIVFRGWLLSAMARKLNIGIAVGFTSILFALLHYDPEQHWLVTANILLFSTFTCCWALTAGNIWGVMGWHAGWNWLLATGFEVPVTGLDAKVPALLVQWMAKGPAYLTGGAQGPEGSLFCGLFFAGASAFLLWRLRGSREAVNPVGPPQELA